MAWQKKKICLITTVVDEKSGKKKVHRYFTNKSKGKGQVSNTNKLVRRKYNPILRKHVEYAETKIKWK